MTPARYAAALAALAAVAGTVGSEAAPLCRDSKGLFTPCPPNRASLGRRFKHPPAPVLAAPAETHDARMPETRRSRAIVTRAKLCRDGKGLFTPCPR